MARVLATCKSSNTKLTLPTHCPSKLPNWAPTALQKLQTCSSVCQSCNTARLPKQPACNSCTLRLRDLPSAAKLLACQSFNTASFPTHCPGQAAKLQARSSNKSSNTASKTAALYAKAPTLQGRVANPTFPTQASLPNCRARLHTLELTLNLPKFLARSNLALQYRMRLVAVRPCKWACSAQHCKTSQAKLPNKFHHRKTNLEALTAKALQGCKSEKCLAPSKAAKRLQAANCQVSTL